MFRERRRRVCFVATIALGLVMALMIPFVAQGRISSPARRSSSNGTPSRR
ncbi:MAG: hypothetical protein M3Y58_05305 [Chloroflexota bacterium]|nr:hypothetical protein [Chloroflexota bacterium]